MMGTFDAYESTIGDADGFIPDMGVRLVVGWMADGTPAWFAETDMVKGRAPAAPLLDALEEMTRALQLHASGKLELQPKLSNE